MSEEKRKSFIVISTGRNSGKIALMAELEKMQDDKKILIIDESDKVDFGITPTPYKAPLQLAKIEFEGQKPSGRENRRARRKQNRKKKR